MAEMGETEKRIVTMTTEINKLEKVIDKNKEGLNIALEKKRELVKQVDDWGLTHMFRVRKEGNQSRDWLCHLIQDVDADVTVTFHAKKKVTPTKKKCNEHPI